MNKQEITKLLPIIQVEFEFKSKQKVTGIKAVNENEIEIIIAIEGSIFTPPKDDYYISLIDIANRQLTLKADVKTFKEALKFFKNVSSSKKKEMKTDSHKE